jgi:hypothetical protein
MNIYTLYIEDDRYTVPTMLIIMADNDTRARDDAVEQLRASPHHLSVEVWDEDRLVAAIPAACLEHAGARPS